MTVVRTVSLASLLLLVLASAPRAQDRSGPRELPRPDLAPAASAGAESVPSVPAEGAAQPAATPASVSPRAAEPAAGAKAPPPDPFATSKPMLDAARRASSGRVEPGRRSVASDAPAVALPKVRLRGTLRVRGRVPAALIEVDGAVYVVRSGDRLDVTAPAAGGHGAGGLTVEVVSIADGTVTLRAGPDGRSVVVR